METIRTMSMVEVLESALNVGFVAFTYKKLNGEIRRAVGTKNIFLVENIVSNFSIRNGKRTPSDSVVTYFDIAKGGFRSFLKEKLISIDYQKLDTEKALYLAIKNEYEISDEIPEMLLDIARDNFGNEWLKAQIEKLDFGADWNDYDEPTRISCSSRISAQRVEPTTTTTSTKSSKENLLDELVEVRNKINELQKRETEILKQLL